jgi:hypothetical protein
MKRSPLDQFRDRMLEAPAEIDAQHLPPRFEEARRALAETLSGLEATGIPGETLVTVMMAEMLPRIVHLNGPEWTAVMLAKLARNIAAGVSPAGLRQ